MNILFIVPSYKPAYIYGGPIVVIALLAESLAKLGHTVTVYTTTANGKAELEVKAGEVEMVDGVQVFYFKRITGDHTHISPGLWRHLNREVKKFDIVHLHSWWNVLIIGAALVCLKNKVTPVLSPHGMFSNYILETNNSSVKTWTQRLIGKKLLKNSILHVSTEMEWEESQKIIPGWRGVVIPNLVILSAKEYDRKPNEVFTIGFLSRIDPKKGLDLLIKALSKVNFPYKLLVAGAGEENYVSSLKNMAIHLGNGSNIEWKGWKKGEDKFEFLAGLDLFALTSHSENFAIVVIESLSVGTPVLVSDQVGLWQFVKQNDYGWITDNSIADIEKQLNDIYKESDKIQLINTTAPLSLKKQYYPETLSKEYIRLYDKYKAGK